MVRAPRMLFYAEIFHDAQTFDKFCCLQILNFLSFIRFLFYASEYKVYILFCSFYVQVKDQLSLLARRFRQTADEKSIEGAQNMLLDSLNCIVLASASDDEPNQSDMNSRRNISSSMAGSDKSVLRSQGNVLHSQFLNF